MKLKLLFKWWAAIFSMLLLLSYGVSYINPTLFWPAYFFSIATPLFILVHLFNVILSSVFVREYKFISFLIIPVLVTYGEVKATYHFFDPIPYESTDKDFKVMSYNVQVMNVYRHLRGKDYKNSKAITSWIIESDAAIFCLQEYYNEPLSELFDFEKKMKQKGVRFKATSIAKRNAINGEFGLAIFSKYPIIHSETIHFSHPEHQNRAQFADVVIEKDTLRIINVHLESYSKRRELIGEGFDRKRKTIGYLIETVQVRAMQAEKLKKCIENSPYKVILCGDFNSVAYEYPYKCMHTLLDNAYEERGSGFGMSRYGEPFPVRIDNQFFSSSITLKSFNTLNNLRYSDHVPLIGIYSCD